MTPDDRCRASDATAIADTLLDRTGAIGNAPGSKTRRGEGKGGEVTSPPGAFWALREAHGEMRGRGAEGSLAQGWSTGEPPLYRTPSG